MSTFRDAVRKFEAAQEKYGKFGAWDTEPRGVWADLLVAKFESIRDRSSTSPRCADHR